METSRIIAILSALAQPTRFRCLELLVAKGECTSSELASGLGVPANTMSSHLTILAHAGLVASTKDGRHVVYRPTGEHLLPLIERLKHLAAV